MADNEKRSLAAKLTKIGKEIGAIKKDGRNTQQNYDYIEYSVVAGRIRELFDEYGVIIIPEVTDYEREEVENKYGSKGYHYTLTMRFTLINADDKDDVRIANWLSEAIDYGDKAVNKAETAGVKYFLMRLFNISEKGEKEADAESPSVVSTHTVQHKSQGNSDGRLDFDKVKSYLKTLTTVEEVEAAKAKTFEKYPKMSDKQKSALGRIFADREDQIEYGDTRPNWHDAEDVVPTDEEMAQIN